jgi:ankyrin repeat protein
MGKFSFLNPLNLNLHYASKKNNIILVKFLLKLRINGVNTFNNYNETALMIASSKGHTEIVKCLLEHGVDVNIINNNNETALMLASRDGYIEIVKLLLKRMK